MKADSALNLVMSRLGGRTDAALRSICLLEMQLLQTRLEGSPTKPWFLFNRPSTYEDGVTPIETVFGGGSLPLPANFLDLDEDERAVYLFDKSTGLSVNLNNVSARLPRDTLLNAELALRSPGSPSIPQVYNVINGRLFFRPLPDKVYIVQIPGYYADVVIADSASSENKWLLWFPDLMIAGTVFEVATKHTRDAEIAAIAKADYDTAYRRLQIDTEVKKHTGMNYVMGGPDS